VILPAGRDAARGDRPGFRFPKEERLRTDREYREVVRKGERAVTAHFTVYRDFPGGGGRKVGISAGKRVGGAVLRNRIKRVLREICRIHKTAFPDGSRTAIVVKKAPSRPGLAAVSAELLPAISRRWGRKEEPSPCTQEISSSSS
jgi:ribonuclease P protein component